MIELVSRKNKRLIESGEFEFETYMTREEVANFLRALADHVERGEIEISSEDWVIKFKFNDPVEVEVEFDADAKKLEFEIEFRERERLEVKNK